MRGLGGSAHCWKEGCPDDFLSCQFARFQMPAKEHSPLTCRNQDRDLEEALSALVDSMPHPPASISGLAQWTPQARQP